MPKHINPMINRNNITCSCESCISAVFLQTDLNKYVIKTMLEVFEILYLNDAPTRILQISKRDYDEYKKEV